MSRLKTESINTATRGPDTSSRRRACTPDDVGSGASDDMVFETGIDGMMENGQHPTNGGHQHHHHGGLNGFLSPNDEKDKLFHVESHATRAFDAWARSWRPVRTWFIARQRDWKESATWTRLRDHPAVAALDPVNLWQQQRRPLLLLGAALFLLLLYRSRSHFSTLPPSRRADCSPYLQRLTEDPPLKVGSRESRALNSYSNRYGYINLIDPYAGDIFNPSVLMLPDTVAVEKRILFVARGKEIYEVIDGQDTRWETIVAAFLLPLKRKHLPLPYLARESDLYRPNLTAERIVPFQRCVEHVYDQFIGPEDPRLFFTNDGQPLLIYSQTGRTPMICRAIFVIDARMVVPGLQKALAKAGWHAPIVFRQQTGERDELFFHVNLVPQQIYKYVANLTLRNFVPKAPTTNCLTDVVGADLNRIKFHHATPLLRVTLCERSQCKPNIHNTILFAMIHIKYHPEPFLHYERRIVTWNSTAPYEYLSVSKPLTYVGTNQADPIFTVSMSWDHPTHRHGLGLNHGYLDDVVMISFGVYDYGSAYIDVLAAELFADHELCETKQDTLW